MVISLHKAILVLVVVLQVADKNKEKEQ